LSLTHTIDGLQQKLLQPDVRRNAIASNMIVPSDNNMSDTSNTDNLETGSDTDSYHSNIPPESWHLQNCVWGHWNSTSPVQYMPDRLFSSLPFLAYVNASEILSSPKESLGSSRISRFHFTCCGLLDWSISWLVLLLLILSFSYNIATFLIILN
jgi:hypothetical protein